METELKEVDGKKEISHLSKRDSYISVHHKDDDPSIKWDYVIYFADAVPPSSKPKEANEGEEAVEEKKKSDGKMESNEG